jgi:hypothetical protein
MGAAIAHTSTLLPASIEVKSLKSGSAMAISNPFIFCRPITPPELSHSSRLCPALVSYSFPLPPGTGPFRMSVNRYWRRSHDAEEEK